MVVQKGLAPGYWYVAITLGAFVVLAIERFAAALR